VFLQKGIVLLRPRWVLFVLSDVSIAPQLLPINLQLKLLIQIQQQIPRASQVVDRSLSTFHPLQNFQLPLRTAVLAELLELAVIARGLGVSVALVLGQLSPELI